MTTLFNMQRLHINTTAHLAKYWREQGQPWIIQPYWDDEKELRLLAFAKALVLRVGVPGVLSMMGVADAAVDLVTDKRALDGNP